MVKFSRKKTVERIIDANINRAKEGLRVCEEIARFILESRSLTADFKLIRHKIEIILKSFVKNLGLLEKRFSLNDIGRDIYADELKRKDCQDIFFANIQRAKESLRVLEEFSKLKDINTAVRFKKIRYEVYEIEKKAAKRFASPRYF